MTRSPLAMLPALATGEDGPATVDRAVPARYDGIDFKPPAAVASAAKRGLRLRKEHGRGGTAVGVARARDLSNRKRVSPETIKRMVSYFARHAGDAQADGWGSDSDPSTGWIAWLLWGGNPGRAWAKRVAREMKRADEDASQKAAETVASWDWLTRDVGGNLARLPDANQRGLMWYDYVRRGHSPAENRLRQRWVGYFRQRAARTADRLRDVVPKSSPRGIARIISDSDLVAVIGTAEEQAAAAEHIGVQRVSAIVRMGWNEAVRAGLDGLEWNPVADPAAAELAKMVQNVDAYTKARTAEIVQGGLLRGDTVNEIQARLMRDISYSPVRALRIARTETTKAATVGSRMAYDDAANIGARFKVAWLSARDAATRTSHADLDGQTIDVGGMFTLESGDNAGQKAPGPGNFAAAAESVNCRCTTIPILD